MQNYLTFRLNQDWCFDPSFREEIITRPAVGAEGKLVPRFPYLCIFLTQGRFLLVKFQSDYVLRHHKPRNAMKSLDTLPADLSSAYREVLDIIDQLEGKETALRILSWLFHAQRLLLMNEPREVLSIETQLPDTELYPEFFFDPVQIIHCCQSLLEFDKSSGIVRFTHYTVQEFL